MPESVEKEFKKINKFCELCGNRLIYKSRAEIKRKRFCSRSCRMRWENKYGILRPEIYDRKKAHPSKYKNIFRRCDICGKKLKIEEKSHLEKKRFCSCSCHMKWEVKYGRLKPINIGRICGRGYVMVGNKFEHRIIMEKKLGRKLKSEEHIHHIDSNRANNAIDNLAILTNSEHAKIHYKLNRGIVVCLSP